MTESLRLCTWNLHLGLELGTLLQAVTTYPDFRDLDLLALQEASIHSELDDARALAQALGPSYDCHQVTAHLLGTRAQANALVWNRERVRIDNTDTVLLPRVRQVRLPRAERTFLCALPQQQRIGVIGEGSIGGEALRFYVAHLDVLGLEYKREQFYRILSDLHNRPPTDLTILAGDMNTFRIRSRPSWASLTRAAEAEGLQDLTSEIRWTHSVRRVHFRQKLDAIWVKSIRPFQYRSWSLDIRGSDHIPVFAQVTFR